MSLPSRENTPRRLIRRRVVRVSVDASHTMIGQMPNTRTSRPATATIAQRCHAWSCGLGTQFSRARTAAAATTPVTSTGTTMFFECECAVKTTVSPAASWESLTMSRIMPPRPGRRGLPCATMPGVTPTEPIAPGRQPRTVILLGSTGSIGTQAIDVLRRHPERFRVVGLSARGADPRALVRQALDTGAQTLALAEPAAVDGVRQAWAELGGGRRGPELLAGPDAAQLGPGVPHAVHGCRLGQREGLRPGVQRLPDERPRVGTTGAQTHHPEPLGVPAEHVDRLGPDRSGGAEQDDGAGLPTRRNRLGGGHTGHCRARQAPGTWSRWHDPAHGQGLPTGSR